MTRTDTRSVHEGWFGWTLERRDHLYWELGHLLQLALYEGDTLPTRFQKGRPRWERKGLRLWLLYVYTSCWCFMLKYSPQLKKHNSAWKHRHFMDIINQRGPVAQLRKSKLHPRVICLPLRSPFLLASSSKVTRGWWEGLLTPFALTSLLSLSILSAVKFHAHNYKIFYSLKRSNRHGWTSY